MGAKNAKKRGVFTEINSNGLERVGKILVSTTRTSHIVCMGKRRRILLAALLVAVLGGLTWEALRPREPVYQGKRLNVWLKEFDGDTNSEAAVAISAIGTNAIPFLIEGLSYKDSAIKIKFMRLERKQHIFRIDFIRDYEINMRAALGFYVLGRQAKTALPRLTELSESKDERIARNALLAMANIGPEAVVPLTNALTNQNEITRILAVSILSEFSGYSPEQRETIIRAISKLLDDPSEDIRIQVTNAIQTIDPEAAAKAGIK